ncbi:MAG: CDP-alcohol phosphatidyltransferase family protein [Pseudomonadota bacterium]|jgi:phosphatidylglycerophosphate synthase|nr:CDP-alcohol phosphatidyltransferase family protein [Pseudomonadota bacterium]
MALVALLYAHHFSAGADEPLAALGITGIASVDRQIRQCRRAGAERVVVMVERVTPRLAAALDRARRATPGVEVVHGGDGVRAAIREEDSVLSLDEGLVADERAIAAVAGATGDVVLGVWMEADERPIAAERIASDRFFAGLARFPGRLVRSVAGRLGDWDMQATLVRSALGEGPHTPVEVGRIPAYCPSRRREVPLQWRRAVDAASADAATNDALAAAQKGILDWPARFIHPPVENLLTRLLLPTPLTPNMISVGVFLLGLAAMAAFALGHLWVGLVLALIIGPLDGVDGKLARTRVEFSKWGDLEHVADKVVEYGWFAALAYYFNSIGHGGAWPLAAICVGFALAEAVQGEFFRRFTGKQIDDAGAFERRFRLVAGRRNTFFWSLLPFAAFGAWYAGFAMIAAYSAITFFVMQARFFVRLQEYGSENSDQIAANFAKTAYTFLPDSAGNAK